MKRNIFLLIFISYFSSIMSQTLNDNWLEQIDKGKAEYAVNNYTEALKYFSKASQMVPTDTTAYTYILDCTYKTQEADLFFKSFDKLLLLNYESARAYLLAIKISTEVEKDYQKAANYAGAAKEKYPKDIDILMADIMIYFNYGDFDSALERLKLFLVDYPKNKKAIDLEYKIYYDIKRDPVLALEVLERAQKYFPNDQEYVKKEVNIYIETQQIDAAEEKFNKLIELNPFEAKHYYNLSLILYNKGEYQKSVELASQAIELDPEFLEAIFNVGTFFYHRALQYNKSLLKMTPYEYTYNGQGRDIELTAKSFFEAAKPYFERAIELNTNELDAFENLNTINALLENIDNNQLLTDPFFTDLENEEKHKVYPDYEVVNFTFIYPNNQAYIEKGQKAELEVTVKNIGQLPIEGAELRVLEPFVNTMLSYNMKNAIPSLAPGDQTTINIPFTYLLNNPNTVGVKKAEGSKNIVRFFVTGTDDKYTDLQQVDIKMGEVNMLAESQENANSGLEDLGTGENFLLIIGIDEYDNWPKLSNAKLGAQSFKQALLKKYKVNNNNIFELYNSNATKKNIINELIKIKGELDENDNLIVFYAGHSYYNSSSDEGAWIPVNANKNSETEYLDNKNLVEFLNSINTKHTFIIADACFSNSLFVSEKDMTYKPNNDKIKSRWGFSSGNFENGDNKLQSVENPFVKYLVEALTENTQSYISVTELVSAVKLKMNNNNQPAPIGRPINIDGNEGGEFLLYSK